MEIGETPVKGPDHRRYAALLGKRVRVTLGHDEDSPVITEGKFLGFGADGEFEILHDDTMVHYCWPLLDIEEVIRVTDNHDGGSNLSRGYCCHQDVRSHWPDDPLW